MKDVDFERFLNEPIYASDFQYMIGDIEDFLDFYESNIEWLYKVELQSIRKRTELKEFPLGYGEHLEENAGHRFKVSLPLRVRYGAVIGLTTSVEWAVRFLVKRLREPVGKRPQGCNETVHNLFELHRSAGVGKTDTVSDYEALVCIRNCIAHSAGIEEHYQFRDQLLKAVSRLSGFTLDNWHFFGRHVCIEKGALNPYVKSMGGFVTLLYKAAHEQGLFGDELETSTSG